MAAPASALVLISEASAALVLVAAAALVLLREAAAAVVLVAANREAPGPEAAKLDALASHAVTEQEDFALAAHLAHKADLQNLWIATSKAGSRAAFFLPVAGAETLEPAAALPVLAAAPEALFPSPPPLFPAAPP